MKTLLLMRHAKSSWKEPGIKDPERPLSKHGKRQAKQAGQMLADNELRPELVISSSVKRARQTTEALMGSFESCCNAIYMDNLFMAEPDILLDTLRLLPDTAERVLVVGHNPGMECLLQILTGQIISMPASGVSNISLAISSWRELNPSVNGELIQLWRPED